MSEHRTKTPKAVPTPENLPNAATHVSITLKGKACLDEAYSALVSLENLLLNSNDCQHVECGSILSPITEKLADAIDAVSA